MTIAMNEQIARAWLLIRAEGATLTQLMELSENIYVNSETFIEEAPAEDIGDREMMMVVRADPTEGPYQMVVPVSAENEYRLDALVDWVGQQVSALGLEESHVDRLNVIANNPFPATYAACYVTGDEAFNPPKGKNKKETGFNAWG